MHATYPLLRKTDFPALRRKALDTLQVNLGYKCNQTCLHCHVNAGPNRTEMMDSTTVDQVLQVLAQLLLWLAALVWQAKQGLLRPLLPLPELQLQLQQPLQLLQPIQAQLQQQVPAQAQVLLQPPVLLPEPVQLLSQLRVQLQLQLREPQQPRPLPVLQFPLQGR